MSTPEVGPTDRRTGTVLLITAGLVVAVLVFAGRYLVDMHRLDAALSLVVVGLASFGFARGAYPRVRPAHVVGFGFLLSYVGIAPIYQLGTRSAAWNDSGLYDAMPERTTFALVLTALALLALVVGAAIGDRLGAARPPVADDSVEVRLPVAWACLAAALLVTPLAVSASGGLAGMFVNRTERAAALLEGGVTLSPGGGPTLALYTQLPAGLSLSATFLFLASLSLRVRSRGIGAVPVSSVIALLVSAAVTTLYVNPLANTRFLFVMAVGSLAILLFRPAGRRAGVVVAALTIVGTLVVYPLANVFRADGVTVDGGAATLAWPDFDGFQQVVNTVAYVDDEGHAHGLYVASALGFAVPRAVWDDKARPAGAVVAEHRGYVFTNLSEPLHAEAYLDFGVVGMVVLMGAVGLAIGAIDHAWMRAPLSRWGIMAPCVALALLGLFRGPLSGQVPFFAPFLVLVLLGLRRVTVEIADAESRDEAAVTTS